jgi:class 3 adenylate cyclase
MEVVLSPVHAASRRGVYRREETRMASDQVKRKLAAILAADIAGYSRLMGADEAGTLVRLKEYRRELIDPRTRNIAVAS